MVNMRVADMGVIVARLIGLEMVGLVVNVVGED